MKIEPRYDNPVLVMVDGQVVVNRLDEVGGECCQTMTREELDAEREREAREFWLRWRHHLQLEQQGRRA